MKREVSPVIVAVGILALLVTIQVVYWKKLGPSRGAPIGRSGGSGGGSSAHGDATPETRRGDSRVTVSTLASASEPGYRDGAASEARFDGPADVAVAPDGTVYVADSRNDAIRRVTPEGEVETAAGGPGKQVFSAPAGVEVSAAHGVLVADTGNHRICRIAGGQVTIFAGAKTPKDELGRRRGGYREGPTEEAQFRYPVGLAAEGEAVYVADAGNHCVRRIADGRVSTVPTAGGKLDTPTGVVVEGGKLYATDAATGSVWSGPTAGPLTRVERDGVRELFIRPSGIAVAVGGLVVADARAQGVYLLTSGRPALLTGQEGTAGLADGGGDAALFSEPVGLARGPEGAVYVADFGNNCVRRVIRPGSSR